APCCSVICSTRRRRAGCIASSRTCSRTTRACSISCCASPMCWNTRPNRASSRSSQRDVPRLGDRHAGHPHDFRPDRRDNEHDAEAQMTDAIPYQITADSPIDDLLARFPATGPLLMQRGRMFRAPKGSLYADYSRMTLGEYAALNGVDTERLLRAVRAAIESDEMSRTMTHGQPPPIDPLRRGSAIGHTSGKSDPGDIAVQDVVTVHSSRGPD